MALVLGMNLNKDNEIWVGGTKVTIDRYLNDSQSEITVHNPCIEHKFTLSKTDRIEVMPNVVMQLADDTNYSGFVRVLVDAPRHIKIERGRVRRNASQ